MPHPLYKQALDAAAPVTQSPITKKAAPAVPRFKTGGKSKDRETPPQFRGPCCGGTRKVGDGKMSVSKCGKFRMYLCQDCRMPLALDEEQRQHASSRSGRQGRALGHRSHGHQSHGHTTVTASLKRHRRVADNMEQALTQQMIKACMEVEAKLGLPTA